MVARHDRSPGWLRSPRFDLTFLLGPTLIALGGGALVAASRRYFIPVLLLDLWLLSYHHVVSTFTRLAMDGESRRRHRFLLLQLPVLVAAVALGMYRVLGLWSIVSLYFYWQWFHYSRQSWGISQAYRRRSETKPFAEPPWLAQLTFYALPVYGILHRSWQAPTRFLGQPLRVLFVPQWAMSAFGAVTLAAMAWVVVASIRSFRQGRLPLAHTLYLVSHYFIFYVGYVTISDLSVGWLVVNIWHNAQYVLFVWRYNNERFKAGVEAGAPFLSRISQTHNAWLYFAVCLCISSAVYAPLNLWPGALPLAVVIYQIVNFHHYVADAVIWRARKLVRQPAALVA